MESAAIHNVELVFLLLLFFVAGLAALAKRLRTPYPIVLVIGGLILSFLPHAPRVELNPNIVFLVILPPLVFSSAFFTSWRDFRYNLVSISMLAFGLVGFTVLGVAAACRWILPGFDWRMGLVLGAVVSTTDAIAATSIAKRVGLPKRIVDILEGESLANDATGLLALQFTVGLLVSGHTPGFTEGAGRLVYLVLASIVIGLIIGRLIYFFESKIDDASIEVTLSLLAPYLAYLAAEGVHSSGVLSTVACGLYLGNKSSFYFSRGARLRVEAVWDTLTFVLNGIVFILIGLQLPYVLGESAAHLGRALWLGLLFSAAVILLRISWVFPGAWIANLIRRRLLRQPEPLPNPRAVFVVAWTGMRGVIALAAAMSLPELLADGSPFPHRGLMIFLTFCVIFVTLVLQGLTLPPLIRWLKLGSAGGRNTEEEAARRAMAEASLAYLEHAREGDSPEAGPVYEELIRLQRRRLDLLEEKQPEDGAYSREEFERFRRLSAQVRSIQRASLLNLRNHNEINDEVMRKLEREIDILEARAAASDFL
ncbi:MAG TPA: Na+/H+ antiporter [Candidatus Acidoferrum sp.]|nr:Na+/H+ antiporter [Candidatus Acidoferrum sp.]